MRWTKQIAAVGLGALVGYVVARQFNEHQNLSPEKALKVAKEAFKRQGPISGSWIHMKTEEITLEDLPYTVYRGGVSRSIDGTTKQFEFYMDAVTGTVLHVSEVA